MGRESLDEAGRTGALLIVPDAVVGSARPYPLAIVDTVGAMDPQVVFYGLLGLAVVLLVAILLLIWRDRKQRNHQ
jgi:hypothetical protein